MIHCFIQEMDSCDVIVDKAALDAIYEAGKNASDDIIRQYADVTVAIADIKVAVRAQKTGKSAEFMRRALAPCDSINVEQLIKAALRDGCNTGVSYRHGICRGRAGLGRISVSI